MAADFIIDELHRVVFSHGTGALTYSDCAGHMDRLSSDMRFRPHFNQIIDFSDVTEVQITVDQIRQLAKRAVFSAKSRRAYVVASDLQHGLSRMFASLRESEGEPGIITFRDLSAAIIWTDVPADAAQKAFSALRAQRQPA